MCEYLLKRVVEPKNVVVQAFPVILVKSKSYLTHNTTLRICASLQFMTISCLISLELLKFCTFCIFLNENSFSSHLFRSPANSNCIIVRTVRDISSNIAI